MLKKIVGEDKTLNSKSKVNFSHLPPCQDSLSHHIQWVNYKVACYRWAAELIFWRPKPYDDGQGWEKKEGWILELVWFPSLIYLLAAGISDDNEGEEDDVEIQFDDWWWDGWSVKQGALMTFAFN